MSNHLFPLKLNALLSRLIDTQVFRDNIAPPSLTSAPVDGKTRLILFSSEIHAASAKYPELEAYDPLGLRKRLAVPTHCNNIGIFCSQTMFEVYSCKGDLVLSQQVTEIPGYLSAALEVELLVMLLEVQGVKIDMM